MIGVFEKACVRKFPYYIVLHGPCDMGSTKAEKELERKLEKAIKEIRMDFWK